MSRFQFVAEHHPTYSVKRLCQVLEINRSSYYKWRDGAAGRAARVVLIFVGLRLLAGRIFR